MYAWSSETDNGGADFECPEEKTLFRRLDAVKIMLGGSISTRGIENYLQGAKRS